MSKEPGQMAFETYYLDSPKVKWEATTAYDEEDRARWAAVESTIREDERAKVWEDAAKREKTLQSKVEAIEIRMGRKTGKLLDCAEALVAYLDEAEDQAKIATDALAKAHADLKVAHFGKGFEYNVRFIAADIETALRSKIGESPP